MPISNRQPPRHWTSPAIGVTDLTGTNGAWVRPGEVLVELGVQASVEPELRRRGARPYEPGGAAGDWRRNPNAPNYGNVNARLAERGIGYRLWTGLPVVSAVAMGDDAQLPGVHLNTVMVAEDFYQGGGGGFPRVVSGPAVAAESTGDGVADVAVLDSGVPADWQGIHPELKGSIQEVGGLLPNIDPLDENPADGKLDARAGHGLFICGLIVRMVRTLTIQLTRVLHASGETDDTLVSAALAETTAPVVNLSLGGYTVDNKPSPLLAAAVSLAVGRGQVIVAAAGNAAGAQLGSPFWNRPFWPAALPDVLAVGAFDSCGGAENLWYAPGAGDHGEDVGTNAADVYAPGVKIRSTYVDGWPHPQGGTSFAGWADWDGTSFAAPIVAATIAEAVAASPGTPARQLAATWFTGQIPKPWPKKPGATLNSRIYKPPVEPTDW